MLPHRGSELLAPTLRQAFLSERQDDWRKGIAAAFTHFGGVARTLLRDNARALVAGRDRETGTVVFHPSYLAFCRDWDVQPRACAPYRARTKGQDGSGRELRRDPQLAPVGGFDHHAQLVEILANQSKFSVHRLKISWLSLAPRTAAFRMARACEILVNGLKKSDWS